MEPTFGTPGWYTRSVASSPKVWYALTVLLIIGFVVFMIWALAAQGTVNKAAATKKEGLSNLSMFGMNPLWYHGGGNAGHGGPMDSSYITGDYRVNAASNSADTVYRAVRPGDCTNATHTSHAAGEAAMTSTFGGGDDAMFTSAMQGL